MKVVVYFRAQAGDEELSKDELAVQRDRVVAWLQEHDARTVAEWTEYEDGTIERRPALAQAIVACKTNSATLLIATTEAIGAGDPFGPRIASVPVEIVPEPKILPDVIDMPASAPRQLGLLFRWQGSTAGVYLCNPGPTVISKIEVASIGIAAALPGPEFFTATSRSTHPDLAPGKGRLIDRYSIYSDGDVLTPFEVHFVDAEGIAGRASVIIDKGGPSTSFVPLKIRD